MIVDDQTHALGVQRARERRADPMGAARDKSHFVLQRRIGHESRGSRYTADRCSLSCIVTASAALRRNDRALGTILVCTADANSFLCRRRHSISLVFPRLLSRNKRLAIA